MTKSKKAYRKQPRQRLSKDSKGQSQNQNEEETNLGNLFLVAKKLGVTGTGVTDSFYVQLSAIAKTNDVFSYCIANEFVSAEMGRLLGLPIPPAALVQPPDSKDVWFSSLNFNLNGVSLPPADNAALAQQQSWIATGILVFDSLVINSDRHRSNLALDTVSNKVSLFDHSHALLGYEPTRGSERLEYFRDRLGISGGALTQGNRHCLLDHLATADYFQEWVYRVKQIPDYFIDDICENVTGRGPSGIEIEKLKEFLKYRKNRMANVLNDNCGEFRGIVQWKMLI